MDNDAASPPVVDTARDLEFSLFYRDQYARLVVFLAVQGAPRPAAIELAQEAMIEAFRGWDAIDHPAAWVRTVISRKWWERRRREQAEAVAEERAARGSATCAEETDEIDNQDLFLMYVRSLPAAQREVMAWTYDGYRPTEIAARLGKEPATVRSLLRQARAALSAKYSPAREQS